MQRNMGAGKKILILAIHQCDDNVHACLLFLSMKLCNWTHSWSLKEEAISRKRNSLGCGAGENLSICCNRVCFWVHSDLWKSVIQFHV